MVLRRSQDIKLNKGDVVNIYSKNDIQNLIQLFTIENRKLTREILFEKNIKPTEAGTVKELVSRFIYTVTGAVAKPGQYLIGGQTSLGNLLNISGGFTSLANKNNINIIYPRLDDGENVILENEDIDFETKDPNEIILSPG